MWKTNRKLIILIFTAALVISQTSCQQKSDSQPEALTLPATKGTIEETVTFIGNVTSSQSSALAWRTSGVIESVEVNLGDKVTEGQILATLSRDSIPPSVLQSEVPLLEAKEDLEDLLASETAKAQSYKDLRDKEVALEDAENYAESLKYPKGLQSDTDYWASQMEITRQFYDDALEDYSAYSMWQDVDDDFYQLQEDKYAVVLSTLNSYAEAMNNYLYYQYNATDNEKDQAAADIDVAEAEYEAALRDFKTYAVYPREKDVTKAQAEVDSAQDTFNRRSIVADVNGVVSVLSSRVGDYVEKGTAAMQLDNTDRIFIPINVSEIDIVKIKDGQKAKVVLDSNSDVTYEGVVTTVSSFGEEDSSRVTFPTMVEILEPDDKMKIGMTAEVNIIIQEKEDALLVPANAVVISDGVSSVDIVKNDVVTPLTVSTGLETDTVAEITSGEIAEGDLILVPSIDTEILEDMGLDMSYMMQTMSSSVSGMPEGMPTADGQMPTNGQVSTNEQQTTDMNSENRENSADNQTVEKTSEE